VLDGQFVGVHALETAHVDRPCLVPGRVHAAGKGFDAAHLAKGVMDCVTIELVVRERIRTGQKLELIDTDEREQRPRSSAHRAVAPDRVFQLHRHFVTYRTAVATSRVSFGFRHVVDIARDPKVDDTLFA
jgi:hypothetical protein